MLSTPRILGIAAVIALVALTPVNIPAAAKKSHGKAIAELLDKVKAAYRAQRYQEAITHTLELRKLRDRPQDLANLGRFHQLLKQDEMSFYYYQLFVRRAALKDRKRPMVVRELKSLRERLRKTRREVQIDAQPAHATLTIDGRTIRQQTPAVVWLSFGEHRVKVLAAGYVPTIRQLVILPGLPMQLRVALKPEPQAGQLTVTSAPVGAQVFLNGVFIGLTPLKGHSVAPGHHLIALRHAGRKAWTRRIRIRPRRSSVVYAALVPTPVKRVQVPRPQPTPVQRDKPNWRVGAWVSLGLGLALVGVGGGLHGWAVKQDSDAERTLNKAVESGPVPQETYDAYRKAANSARTKLKIAVAGYALGGALLVTSAVLFVIDSRRGKKRQHALGDFQLHVGFARVNLQMRF